MYVGVYVMPQDVPRRPDGKGGGILQGIRRACRRKGSAAYVGRGMYIRKEWLWDGIFFRV